MSSRKGLKWCLDEEILLLKLVKINQDNHTKTSMELKRTEGAIISRLVSIYHDRICNYTGNTPSDIMEELYLTSEDIDKYKKTNRNKTTKQQIQDLNTKLDYLIDIEENKKIKLNSSFIAMLECKKMDFTDIIIAGKVSDIDMDTLSLDDINNLIKQLTDHKNMQKMVGCFLESQQQNGGKKTNLELVENKN